VGHRAGVFVAVLTLRPGYMPGFTELALDPHLAQLLGTQNFGALIRLCHLAEPSGDVPGSWVISHSQGDLAQFLSCSRNKVSTILNALCEARALTRSRGIRLGKSMGATNDRYFVTAVPGLTAPEPTTPPTSKFPLHNPAVPMPNHSMLNNSTLNSVTVKKGTELSLVSSQSGDLPAQDVSHLIKVSNKPLLDDVNKQPETTNLLRQALTKLDWVGDLPDHPNPLLVAQVATWLLNNKPMKNPAGYLSTILRKGDLETFAETLGMSTRAAGASAAEPEGFTSTEYVQLRDQFPQWEELVQAEAARVSAVRGTPVRMALLCEVAATVALPEQTQVIGST